MFVLIPMKASTICTTNLSTFRKKNEKKKYKIVGKDEANAKEGLLFYKSPIALELVSKHTGDFVSVKTPAGEKNYEIIEVKYI